MKCIFNPAVSQCDFLLFKINKIFCLWSWFCLYRVLWVQLFFFFTSFRDRKKGKFGSIQFYFIYLVKITTTVISRPLILEGKDHTAYCTVIQGNPNNLIAPYAQALLWQWEGKSSQSNRKKPPAEPDSGKQDKRREKRARDDWWLNAECYINTWSEKVKRSVHRGSPPAAYMCLQKCTQDPKRQPTSLKLQHVGACTRI